MGPDVGGATVADSGVIAVGAGVETQQEGSVGNFGVDDGADSAQPS